MELVGFLMLQMETTIATDLVKTNLQPLGKQ